MLDKLKRHYPILLLTAGHGAVDFYIGLLQVVAPGLAVYLGVPLGDLIMLVGISGLLNNIAQPVAGYIMGRKNLSWILWFSIALSALPAFMGLVPGFWSLAAIILLGAMGTGLYHPEGALSAHEATGEKAYLGVPLFMAGGAGIYAIATPLSIKLTETFGFPALAWTAVPGLIVAALFLFQYRERKRRHPSVVIRPRSKRVTKVQPGHMSFWPLLIVTSFFAVAGGMFIALLSSHYELTFGPEARTWAGWVLMVFGFAGSLCSFWWSAVAHKRGFYQVVLLTQALAFPLYGLMAFPPSAAAGFIVSIPLSIVSSNAVYAVAVTMARNAAGLTQALRTSLLMGGTAGLSSVAVMVSGALLRRGMPSSRLMLFIALCSLMAVLLSVWQLLRQRAAGRRKEG